MKHEFVLCNWKGQFSPPPPPFLLSEGMGGGIVLQYIDVCEDILQRLCIYIQRYPGKWLWPLYFVSIIFINVTKLALIPHLFTLFY